MNLSLYFTLLVNQQFLCLKFRTGDFMIHNPEIFDMEESFVKGKKSNLILKQISERFCIQNLLRKTFRYFIRTNFYC